VEELRRLVIRAQGRDWEAYSEIVVRFREMAYGYSCSVLGDAHLAEDAVQEAFMEAYRYLPKLREPVAFASWFRKIVFKHCDRLTRRKEVPKERTVALGEVKAEGPGPAETAERREMTGKVLEEVKRLSENRRTVTKLFYIEGFSLKEIAGFLGVPEGTVKRRLFESRNDLKERI